MPMLTELNMDAVRREFQEQLSELRARGYFLPYLQDGRLVYEGLVDGKARVLTSTEARELGIAEATPKSKDPPPERDLS